MYAYFQFHSLFSSCKKTGRQCLEHSMTESDEDEDKDEMSKENDSETMESSFFFKRHQTYRQTSPNINSKDETSSQETTPKENTLLYKICSFYVNKPKICFCKYVNCGLDLVPD